MVKYLLIIFLTIVNFTSNAQDFQIIELHKNKSLDELIIEQNEENFDEVFLKLNTLLLEYKLYEALPIELKKYLKSLKAVHDMGAFRNNYTKNEPIGTAHKLNEGHQKFGSSIHPIVKTHPITKKNYIYI